VVNESSTSSHGQKELYLHKKSVQNLLELEGDGKYYSLGLFYLVCMGVFDTCRRLVLDFFLFCPSWLYVLCYLLEFDAKEKVKKNHVTLFILAFWCSFFPENQLMI
jgi:hypothetical protein